MTVRLALLLVWGLLLASVTAGAVDLSAAQAERYHALTHELRCLVCQNQSIASSNAGLAADLRKQVAHKIVAGQSNAQIKHYLVARYGQWVLYDPPFQWSTWLLWLGPFVLLAIGLLVVFGLTRCRGRGDSLEPRRVDRKRLAAVLADTADARGDGGRRARTQDD